VVVDTEGEGVVSELTDSVRGEVVVTVLEVVVTVEVVLAVVWFGIVEEEEVRLVDEELAKLAEFLLYLSFF
jgi:hypothetical protein